MPVSFFRWFPYLLIFGAIFIVPLFFLPFSSNVLDFPKQLFLFPIAASGILFLIWKQLSERILEIRISIFVPIILLLIIVEGISTITSSYSSASFWGLPLPIASSFLSTISFAFFFFFLIYILQSTRSIFWFLFILIAAVVFAIGIGLLNFFELFILPWEFARTRVFTLVGDATTLPFLAVTFFPVALSLFVVSRPLLKIVAGIFVGLFLVVLFFMGSMLAWVLLLAGISIIAWGSLTGLRQIKIPVLSFVSLGVAVLALFFIVVPSLPLREVGQTRPVSYESDIHVVRNFYSNEPNHMLVGSGPGTFSFLHTQYKPSALNETPYSDMEYTGSSGLISQFATSGILGGSLLMLIFGFAFAKGFLFIFQPIKKKMFIKRNVSRIRTKTIQLERVKKERGSSVGDGVEKILGLGVFAAFVILVGIYIFVPLNFTLSFLFWIFLGLLTVVTGVRIHRWKLSRSSFLIPVLSLSLILFLITTIAILFAGAKRYAADMFYIQAVQSEDIRGALIAGERTVQINPSSDVYRRMLARLYMTHVNALAQTEDGVSRTEVQPLIGAVRAHALRATMISPRNVENWIFLADIYERLGLGEFAIQAYRDALLRAPLNPEIYTGLGDAHVLRAEQLIAEGNQREAQKHIGLAHEAFDEAISLKPDLAQPYIKKANLFEQQGQIKEAIGQLEQAVALVPADPGLVFELGYLYWREGNILQARETFERTISLYPQYADAQYMLGLVYDAEGKQGQALEAFQRVAELNPENEKVKRIIQNLRQGNSALEGLDQEEAIEEVVDVKE